MNMVAVWPPAAEGLRNAPDEVVAHDVTHTNGGAAHTCTSQTCADVCAHLYDVAFHLDSPYVGIGRYRPFVRTETELVVRMQGILQINTGQDREDIRLYEGHEDLQGVDGRDGQRSKAARWPQWRRNAAKTLITA